MGCLTCLNWFGGGMCLKVLVKKKIFVYTVCGFFVEVTEFEKVWSTTPVQWRWWERVNDIWLQ